MVNLECVSEVNEECQDEDSCPISDRVVYVCPVVCHLVESGCKDSLRRCDDISEVNIHGYFMEMFALANLRSIVDGSGLAVSIAILRIEVQSGGVKALEIKITRSTYHMPDILTSASSLTSLKVSDCMLPSSLMVEVANFKSLKVLQLNCVRLDPLVMKHLTASCPLLEELIVEYCYGFKKFCLYGRLQNLKKARFFYNGEKGFGGVDIEAPNM
ncbi:F-box domain containing protein [Tanacetum coccineum]